MLLESLLETSSTSAPHDPCQTDSTVSKPLPKVLTLNVVPGLGWAILKNSSIPPRPAAGLGCTLAYVALVSWFVKVNGKFVMLTEP